MRNILAAILFVTSASTNAFTFERDTQCNGNKECVNLAADLLVQTETLKATYKSAFKSYNDVASGAIEAGADLDIKDWKSDFEQSHKLWKRSVVEDCKMMQYFYVSSRSTDVAVPNFYSCLIEKTKIRISYIESLYSDIHIACQDCMFESGM